jgi:hypothetical protein
LPALSSRSRFTILFIDIGMREAPRPTSKSIFPSPGHWRVEVGTLAGATQPISRLLMQTKLLQGGTTDPPGLRRHGSRRFAPTERHQATGLQGYFANPCLTSTLRQGADQTQHRRLPATAAAPMIRPHTVRRPPMERRDQKYALRLARFKEIAAAPTAVAHPCDENSLGGAVEAARIGIIRPLLVGPSNKIEAVA